MGGYGRSTSMSGKTFKEAWKNLQAEEEYELGNDAYNGGFNNCDMPRLVSDDKFDKYEEGELDISKRECVATVSTNPIPNTNKIKTEVTRYPNKGTRKWETIYVATPRYTDTRQRIESKTLQDCINKARAYVEKHPNEKMDVTINKKLVGKEKGNDLCAEISYKKSSTERPGSWKVYGVVPC